MQSPKRSFQVNIPPLGDFTNIQLLLFLLNGIIAKNIPIEQRFIKTNTYTTLKKIRLSQHEFSVLFDSYRSKMNNNNTSFYYYGDFANF